MTAAADAVLFCTPEYAGALPGSFKNLLDWTVGGGETYGKPAAWINRRSMRAASSTSASSVHRGDGHGPDRHVRVADQRRPNGRRPQRDESPAGTPATGRGTAGSRSPAPAGSPARPHGDSSTQPPQQRRYADSTKDLAVQLTHLTDRIRLLRPFDDHATVDPDGVKEAGHVAPLGRWCAVEAAETGAASEAVRQNHIARGRDVLQGDVEIRDASPHGLERLLGSSQPTTPGVNPMQFSRYRPRSTNCTAPSRSCSFSRSTKLR